MAVVFAPRPMDMRLGRRRCERLVWEHDSTGFVLLGEMCRDVRMVGTHVSDEAGEKALRLEPCPGEVRNKPDRAIQHIGGEGRIGDLLWVLFLE